MSKACRPTSLFKARLRTRITALFGAVILLTPSVGVIAGEAAAMPADATPSATHRVKHAAGHYETVEQRISSLHKSLKITADQETAWGAVAQSMRDTDATMQKLVADHRATEAQKISAVDDLKTYESFTQAHVDGLKSLIASFETLYASMPADQQAVADGVFQRFGHKGATVRK